MLKKNHDNLDISHNLGFLFCIGSYLIVFRFSVFFCIDKCFVVLQNFKKKEWLNSRKLMNITNLGIYHPKKIGQISHSLFPTLPFCNGHDKFYSEFVLSHPLVEYEQMILQWNFKFRCKSYI